MYYKGIPARATQYNNITWNVASRDSITCDKVPQNSSVADPVYVITTSPASSMYDISLQYKGMPDILLQYPDVYEA